MLVFDQVLKNKTSPREIVKHLYKLVILLFYERLREKTYQISHSWLPKKF